MDDPPFWAAESVAAFLREQAAWRHAQAERFPSDRRNFRSASALEQLAAYVGALPATDLALNELIAVKAFEDDLRFIASDEARRAVTRYGFDHEPTPRTLLQELVAITRRARRLPAQERNSKMIATTTPAIERAARELTDAERVTLIDIFTIAQRHDPECREKEQELLAAIAAAPKNWNDDGILTEYEAVIRNLCATIAPAAIARLEILAPLHKSDGRILDLLDRGREKDLARFLRPILDEAGIGDDFVADLRGSWDPDQTLASLDDAEKAIGAFISAPNVKALEVTLEAALAAIEKIGPPPPETTVDWDASKRILRRTIKTAGQPRGSTYAASVEAPNLLSLFREDVARYTSADN